MAKCEQCGRQLPPLTFGRKVCQWCKQYEAAQRGEDQSEYQPVIRQPWQRRSHDPVVTYILVGLNVAVFIAMVMAGVSVSSPTIPQLIHWGANFGPLTLSGQPWRLVSAMFLHIGFLHIAFNMWCLYDLGMLAESLYGRWTFLSIYMLTGVASSLTSLWWHPQSVSAGASGAIFGIVGALIAAFKLGEFTLPRAAIQGVLRSVLVFAGYNLVFGAIMAQTDNAAHVGGLIAGLVLGAAIAKLAPVSAVRRIGIMVVVGFIVLGAGAYLFRSRAYVAYTVRAAQLEQSGNHDEAIAALAKAVSARPDDPRSRYMLGVAYARKGQLSDAEREFKYLAAHNPDAALIAHYELGLVYLNQQRPQEAASEFNHVLAVDHANADAHLGLGSALAEQNDNASAVREYKTALQLDPQIAHGYYHLGTAYTRLGQYDDAIAALNQAIANDDNDADAQLALSRAYAGKGMKDQAAAALAKAHEMAGQQKQQQED
jgi:membrane associated rhomboid family serine protease/Flp pilus assembly protein TadD